MSLIAKDRRELEKAVGRGVALLDAYVPGWETQLNLDDLNMSSGDYCVLGQMYGDYMSGLSKVAEEAVQTEIAKSCQLKGLKAIQTATGDSLVDDLNEAVTQYSYAGIDGAYYGFEVPDKDAPHAPEGWSLLTEMWLGEVQGRVAKKQRAAARKRAKKARR